MEENRSPVLPSSAEIAVGCLSFLFFRVIVIRLSRFCFGSVKSYRYGKIGIREEWDTKWVVLLCLLILFYAVLFVICILHKKNWPNKPHKLPFNL